MTDLSVSQLIVRRGATTVLRGGSARVCSPGVALCTGPNGSGKTTLLEALAGILPTEGGTVTHGAVQRDLVSEGWRDSVSYMPSDGGTIALLTGTEQLRLVLELSGVGIAETERRIDRLGEIYQLHGNLHARADTLSTGMKKRLGLAIAVAMPADLFLLDEPSAGLDAHGVLVLRNTISALRASGAIVIITSNAFEAFAGLADSQWKIAPEDDAAVLLDDSVPDGGAAGVNGSLSDGVGAFSRSAKVELPWLRRE